MVKSAQPGEGGWYTPSLFTPSTNTSKVVVYALAESADILLLFLLYPFVLCGLNQVCFVSPTPIFRYFFLYSILENIGTSTSTVDKENMKSPYRKYSYNYCTMYILYSYLHLCNKQHYRKLVMQPMDYTFCTSQRY
jgi:hypothetical protein